MRCVKDARHEWVQVLCILLMCFFLLLSRQFTENHICRLPIYNNTSKKADIFIEPSPEDSDEDSGEEDGAGEIHNLNGWQNAGNISVSIIWWLSDNWKGRRRKANCYWLVKTAHKRIEIPSHPSMILHHMKTSHWIYGIIPFENRAYWEPSTWIGRIDFHSSILSRK